MTYYNNSFFSIKLLIALVVFLMFTGCTSLKNATIVIHNQEALPVRNLSSFMAGASRADITPPLGLPLAGHSRNGNFNIGVRTRLYVRVLYLKPAVGRPVALIQADILSGSRILHHKIAELIASKTDIEAGGLVLAGTHTHSGQGNYFGDAVYDRMASKAPGFDERLFNFMADRISAAVIRAYNERRPAKIATGSIMISGATRNRSLPAYYKNKSISNATPSAQEAVNPELRMIRVDCLQDDGLYVPIGAFSNFSMHPNLTNRDTGKLYNGDVTAYAEREVEWGIKRLYPTSVDPIHAIANFTHGDLTPDYLKDEKLGYSAMRRVGVLVGGKALELFISLEKNLSSNAVIRYRAGEVDVYQNRCIDGECLCGEPAAGQSTFAGGSDRSLPIVDKLPGFAPGWPKKFGINTCQGVKRIMGGSLQHKVFPLNEYPHVLFMQALQINDTVLLPLPFEITVQTGKYIAGCCLEQARKQGLADARYIVMDVSNGYWGYCATPDEYSVQHYEGGSTLYGPNTMKFLAAHLSRLVSELNQGSGGSLPSQWTFDVRIAKSYYPTATVFQGQRKAMSVPEFHDMTKKKDESYWSFQWRDASPALIELNRPLVCIEVSDDGISWQDLIIDKAVVDDGGYDVAIVLRKTLAKEGASVYETRWYNPVREQGKNYRFKILPRQGRDILNSPPF